MIKELERERERERENLKSTYRKGTKIQTVTSMVPNLDCEHCDIT